MLLLKKISNVFIFLLLCFSFAKADMPEVRTVPITYEKTIAIDPGHGGNDTGIKGIKGSFEKNITLNLANILKKKLLKKIKVVLTREGDYNVDIFDRTATANYKKADIFISIHTGGSFLRTTAGTAIYYYKPAYEINEKISSFRWDVLQIPHIKKSSGLAEILKIELSKRLEKKDIKIYESQIAILKGADCPALLIEVGHPTNSEQETKLDDESVLDRYAEAISDAIDNFFKDND